MKAHRRVAYVAGEPFLWPNLTGAETFEFLARIRGGVDVAYRSHILSEVEALIDRVGLLRDGKLIDQGTLAELRHLSAQTLDVTFAGPAPSFDGLPGVRVTKSGPNTLHFEVTGTVGALIQALAARPVIALSSRNHRLRRSSCTTTPAPTAMCAYSAIARRAFADSRIRTIAAAASIGAVAIFRRRDLLGT